MATMLNIKHLTVKKCIFVSSFCRYRHLTDILKKAHFAYSDPVNLDTSRLAKAYVISEYGKRRSSWCCIRTLTKYSQVELNPLSVLRGVQASQGR